jgi:MYXO-CTERM domain-containing protein
MRESELRRIFKSVALAASIAVAGATVPSVASAQATQPGATETMNTEDDDDTDWGWIGLLGLAGLLGLRRRDRDHVHVDTTTRRP